MCLAVPGEVLAILDDAAFTRQGRVRFGSVERRVSLVFVPDASPGDFVVVHAGIAIARLDEDAARRTLADLEGLLT